MRNLKKILSLALALVMVMSLLTVAGAREFNDAADIEHTEAVEVMSALGVINGKGNNTFDPKGNVTRAEMAKMITLISLGNVEPNAFLGTTTNLTDINGHWAEAYIKYCYSQGIIAGRGNGIFDPNANVTATEAARMLLVAIGYNADVQVYTGASWAINVVRDATTSGFYDDVTVTSTEILNRDKAAQMMYNALNAFVIVKTSEQSRVDGSIVDSYGKGTETLLNKAFKGQIYVGTFTGNHNTDSSIPTGNIQVKGDLEKDYQGLGDQGETANFPYEFDISHIGEEVKVIFKDGTSGTPEQPDRLDTIYGVYVTGSSNVVTATMDNVGDQKSSKKEIKVSGTTYKTAADVDVIYNYDSGWSVGSYVSGSKDADNGSNTGGSDGKGVNSALTTAIKDTKSNAIKLVFNGDSEVTAIYVTEYKLGKVTSVTSDKISISGVGAFDIEDNDIYSGVAKDDVVVYTRFYSDDDLDDAYFTVQLAETVEGTLTAYDATDNTSDQKKASIDGTSYKIFGKKLEANLTDDAITNLVSHNGVGKAVKAYMVNGMIGALQAVEEGTRNYALVMGTNGNTTNTNNMTEGKVRLLLTDGTKVTYVIDEKSTVSQAAAGKLIRYSVKSNGNLDIVEVYNTAASVADGALVWNNDTKQVAVSAGVAASNSVLFVKTGVGADDWKVYNIRDLKSITASGAKTVTYARNTSGQVVAAAVDLGSAPAGDGSTRYGLVTKQDGITTIGDTNYSQYTIWTGEESVTVYIEGNDRAALSEKHMYKFDLTADRQYSNASSFIELTDDAEATGLNVAIKEHNEGDKILSYYTNLTQNDQGDWIGDARALETKAIDDDVQIIYVDADGPKAGSPIGVTPFNASTGFANAKIIVDNSKIIAIIVGSNFETNVDGAKSNSWTPVVTLPAPEIDTNKDTAGAGTAAENKYKVTVPTEDLRSGDDIVVTVEKTKDDAAKLETVTIDYKITTTTRATITGTVTVEFAATDRAGTKKTATIEDVTGKLTITNTTVAAKAVLPEGATAADINAKLNASDRVETTGTVSGDITVPADKTLVVSAGAPTITGAGTVEVPAEGSLTYTDLDDLAEKLGTAVTAPTAGDASGVDAPKAPVLKGEGKLPAFDPSATIDELASKFGTEGDTISVYTITLPSVKASDKLSAKRTTNNEEVNVVFGAGNATEYAVQSGDLTNVAADGAGSLVLSIAVASSTTKIVYSVQTGDEAARTYTYNFNAAE